ncbi:MAG TPA: response regulator transcription factor [Opitutaceae bacterium]|nr:response regulator transcription factor [Opitutaceae bacterium]
MPRILIIEDDPDLAEFMAITLRTAGHEVRLAGDGITGLHALRTAPPALLILDVMLPDIVGLSLCEQFRHDDQGAPAPVPILITSACDEAEIRPLADAAGADDFLAKPFSPYQLLLRVHTLLDQAARQRLAS